MPQPFDFSFEKTPLSSKKFLAFLLAEVTWKAVLIIALLVFRDELQQVTGWGWWFMLSVVIVAGFMEAGYLLGQAALDKYTRVAMFAAGVHPSSSGEKPDGHIS